MIPDDGCDLCRLSEVEPNNTLLTPTPLALDTLYRGRLSFNDVDFFSVLVEQDRSYRVEVFVGEAGACALAAFPSGLVMSLHESDGGDGFQVFANDEQGVNNRLGRCPFFQWRVNGDDGLRYIRLTHGAGETLEPYFIRVSALAHNQPSAPYDVCSTPDEVCSDGDNMVSDGCHLCRRSENEQGNGDPTTGAVISPPEVMLGTVNFGDDWFRFSALQGHAYRVETFIGGVDACVDGAIDEPQLAVFRDSDITNGGALIVAAPSDGFFHMQACAMVQYTHTGTDEPHFIRVSNNAPDFPNDVYGLRVLDLGLVDQ